MQKKFIAHQYHNSFRKWLFDFVLSFAALIILSPLLFVIAILIKLTSKGPIFFRQKRVGEKGKTFEIVMFRTMKVGAEGEQKRLRRLNEADWPVFKIRNDPRFVGIGKFLAWTGLDELPQLINTVKGEMSLIGPRPLPADEAKKLTKAQNVRLLIKPGMTSTWIIKGAHSLKFKKWMLLDKEYVLKASLAGDIAILTKTFVLILKLISEQLLLALRKQGA